MRRYIVALVLSCVPLCVLAGREEVTAYSAASISSELAKNAHAVLRTYQCKIKVNSPTDIKLYNKYVYTILDDKGYKYAVLDEHFTNMYKITSVSGRLFDAAGSEVKSLKSRDVKEEAIPSYNIADDLKRKYYDFHYANYPFTVEYEVETTVTSLFFIDNHAFAGDYYCSVESADLEIEYPADMKLSYKLVHTDVPVQQTTEGNIARMKVAVKDIYAMKRDPLAVPELFRQPAIMLLFDKMVMGSASGSMQTWADYGRFFYDLNKDRDILPADIKLVVHQLADTCKTVRGKVDVLFDYMKNNTRYVSIQLGIGGWQTFDAQNVMKTGYGDCKALTNCMKGMLKEAGVVSYAALIYGGDKKVPYLDRDFPANMFNHVILCVPQPNDTVWVECTSDDLAPGYLSEFTHNRNALLITEKGGVVVKTPVYAQKQNTINRRVDIKMDVEGNATVVADILLSGEFAQDAMDTYKGGVKTNIDKMLYNRLDLLSAKLTNAAHSSLPSTNYPILKEKIELSGAASVNITGKRVFLKPLISSVKKSGIASVEKRTTPFYISDGYTITDTLVYSFAEKLTPEMLPQAITIEKPFGKYTFKASFDNQQLKLVRTMEQYMGAYAASMYEDYLELLSYAALNNDDLNAVFVKQ